MQSLLLQLTGINKSFLGVKALSDAALSVYSGKVMALIGENGAGKSTLMKILTGIYQKDSGSISYLGNSTIFTNPRHSQMAGIGIIHQELNLIPQLTIAENIFLGREPTNKFGFLQWKTMYQDADKLLARLKFPHNSSKKQVSELSIGEQQLVEIAKVLSFQSKVIIMDEPTDALTDTETASLFAIIRELTQSGCGVVYISHRLSEIFTICDAITIMRDGQFIAEKNINEITEEQLIEMMVGRKLEDRYPHIEHHAEKIVLQMKEISGNGIENISFELYQGEILGIAGLMGAGRSELMKMIYGALPVDHGEMLLENKKVVIKSAQQGLANGIVYISEDRKKDGLILSMSVKENMSLTALPYFSRLNGSIKLKDEITAVSRYVNTFNIKTPTINQLVKLLSGGNQQKIAIARGLMTRPKVLILDEPTRGVDVGAKKEIYQLINQFRQKGVSIILVSSDMPEILGMSDRVLVLHEGKLSAQFSREQATQERIMAAAIGKNKE